MILMAAVAENVFLGVNRRPSSGRRRSIRILLSPAAAAGAIGGT